MLGIILGSIAGVIVLLLIIFAIWGVVTFNGFVRLRNNVDEAFSTMDIYLKKRYDLIPNLVETVKGYTKHENETLTNVIKARNIAMASSDPSQRVKNENALSGTLKSLFKVTEKYPDLKADRHFTDLMGQLKSIENEIASSRKYYNGCVKAYNTKTEVFPSSVIARWKKFEKRDLFEVEEPEERKNIRIQF